MVHGLALKHPQVQRLVFTAVVQWVQIAFTGITARNIQSDSILRLESRPRCQSESTLDGLHD